MRLPALALILLAAASPARAGEVVFDPAPLAACRAEHGRADPCIGAGYTPCMEATPFGASNQGMTRCMAAELDWWEALLARLLDDLREAEAAFDAAPPEPWPDLPSALDALEQTQALWEAWVEARCNYTTIEFLGGTMRGTIWVGCRLELTAGQADFLARRLSAHSNR